MKLVSTIIIALPLMQLSSNAAVLFADTFDRANNRNIDAVLDGITNDTGSLLPADSVYSQPWLDPASQAPTYGVQDGNPANGGGTQILANKLQLKVGVGTVNAYINHNFTNSSILSAGGFSVTIDVTGYNQATINQGGAFGIGMTAAEAASMKDAVGNSNNEAHLSNAFGAGFPGQTNAVADFWFGIRGDNSVVWGSRDTIFGSAVVGAKTGTISANFTVLDFNAGSTVGYEVFYGGVSKGTGTFQWTDTNANFIGLDGRDNSFLDFDNLSIATIPEPSATLFALAGLGLLTRRRR